MNSLHALHHLVRADFLERVRRYSFLIALGAAVFLGYVVVSDRIHSPVLGATH